MGGRGDEEFYPSIAQARATNGIAFCHFYPPINNSPCMFMEQPTSSTTRQKAVHVCMRRTCEPALPQGEVLIREGKRPQQKRASCASAAESADGKAKTHKAHNHQPTNQPKRKGSPNEEEKTRDRSCCSLVVSFSSLTFLCVRAPGSPAQNTDETDKTGVPLL